MQLPEICIRRPVFATVMSLMIVLVGAISFTRLTVREYPKIDTPVVSVRTVYKGASPQVIESQVTVPIEDSISGIEGVRTVKSVSREEVSQITVEFLPERDVDAAANDVRDRVARVRAVLPEASDDSVVSKIEADAQAIMWLAFNSERHGTLELSDYADRYIADRLKTLPGVASVIIGGNRRYAMRIWLDRDRLAAYSLTPQDVENALRRQNVEIPAGRIESSQREFTVLAEADFRTAEQFNGMIVTQSSGYPVRLRDVGTARLGALDERSIIRVNGNPAVGLGIVKQSTANTLSVAQAVKQELTRITRDLPEGMKLQVAFDSSIFIERSIAAVYTTMLEAVALVVAVIFIFLRSVRSTLIPFVTIPVSLVGAFFFLYLLGFSINVLTLLGIVLAIGLVVDDAIVVLENCHRHLEMGKTPQQAAADGSREIAFAVIAMSLTLTAVFAPVAFVPGNTGKLFAEFALTVASAVAVSGFVALTLTPMMCSKVLKGHEQHGGLYLAMERFFTGMTSAYRGSLSAVLRWWWAVALVFAAVLAACIALTLVMKQELSPSEDRGFFLSMILAPEGASMDYTDANVREVERIYRDVPELRTTFAVVAPGLERPSPVNVGVTFSQLKLWDERERKTQQITAALAPRLFALPGVMAFPINPPSLGQSFRNPPLQYVVQANSYEALDGMVNQLLAKARESRAIANPDSDLRLNKPQLSVDIDREKAAALGIDVETIGRTLETLLGGRQVTRFKREGKQYDVMVQLEAKDRNTPADLTAIYVRARDGTLVQLSNLVRVSETVAAKELNHFNRQRAAIISANINPGYTLGEALDVMDKAAGEVLPPSARTELDGVSREFRESGASLLFAFALALVFIYLMLSAQFESFVSPFVIILTVPLAALGALLALLLTGGTLNVYSKVGLVMLIGLITKHGILIVEFANQLRAVKGLGPAEAVLEAAALRLRPILMTTGAMVLGAVPLALATGAGAEARQPIGWVIVGGLTVGTLFTLYVIPTAYLLLTGGGRKAAPAEAHVAAAQ